MIIKDILTALLSYSSSGDNTVDIIFFISSVTLLLVSAIAMAFLLISNPNIRLRKRPEDRFMFWESVLVFILLSADLICSLTTFFDGKWIDLLYYIVGSTEELCYMLVVLQWLVFVDYSLYRSMDHIRRRYRHAIIPIVIVMTADILQSGVYFVMGDLNGKMLDYMNILQYCKLGVELWYILIAVRLVKNHGKETRTPKFLRIEAFIIPFILSCLFRLYDASFVTLGIILTYGSIRRRDSYLDHDTGFYNREYLDYLGRYRDQKGYKGGSGMIITAKGHGKEIVELLRELKPSDSEVFVLGDDRFLLLSESVRSSAVDMAVRTLTEAAGASEDAFIPEIITAERRSDESAVGFMNRLTSGNA
ncbi:MAG: hypothetical protein K6G42_02870 [Lachnospiraceae bacterium]|nr:hypothetical protein [Lachnospiraceae bacterium]